jgi:hypothetical protein
MVRTGASAVATIAVVSKAMMSENVCLIMYLIEEVCILPAKICYIFDISKFWANFSVDVPHG